MARVAGDQQAISVAGLDAMRATLRVLGKDAGREGLRVLKEAASVVASDASTRAPRQTGALARSIKPSVRGSRVIVGSRLPYANVIHWGGTTGRGHQPGVGGSGSVRIKGRKFLVEAADAKAGEFERKLTEAVNGLVDRIR